MNIPELMLDQTIRAQIDVLRLEASIQRDVLIVLKRLEKELVALVRDVDPTGVTLTHAQRLRLEKLLKQASELIRGDYSEARQVVLRGLKDVSRLATEQAADIVNLSFGADLAVGIADSATLAELAKETLVDGAPSADWWKQQSQTALNRFSQEMRKGVAASESTQQLTRRIMGEAAKGGALAKLGVNGLMRYNAEALVRTSVQTVANTVRMETYRQNDDIIRGIQWVSTLDNRTTPICRALDGMMWDLDYKPIGASLSYPGPIAHWGCRSTQVPLMVSWKDLISDPKMAAKLDALELNAGERASVNGPVPRTWTYETWLKSQPETSQIQILGRGRYELLQAGKITFTQLVDQRGSPRTLDQLRALRRRKAA